MKISQFNYECVSHNVELCIYLPGFVTAKKEKRKMLRYITRNIGNIDFLCCCWHTFLPETFTSYSSWKVLLNTVLWISFYLWISENYETIDMCLTKIIKPFPLNTTKDFLPRIFVTSYCNVVLCIQKTVKMHISYLHISSILESMYFCEKKTIGYFNFNSNPC